MSLIGSLTLVEVECGNCITHFAIDDTLQQRCLETGRKFYCPNGHANYYQDDELSRLREEREKLKQEADNARKRMAWAERQANDLNDALVETKKQYAATKGQLTKTRKRIAHGVCPCCNRTFANVARHVTSKHPDFKVQANAE